jgi:hypothetical protein
MKNNYNTSTKNPLPTKNLKFRKTILGERLNIKVPILIWLAVSHHLINPCLIQVCSHIHHQMFLLETISLACPVLVKHPQTSQKINLGVVVR